MRISDWSSDVCSSDLENQINTERYTLSAFGTYYAGDHVIKGGFDYLRHDVYNLYGRDLHGSYVFTSLADFAAGDSDVYNLRRPSPGYPAPDTAAPLVYSPTGSASDRESGCTKVRYR